VNGTSAEEADYVKLYCQVPPINKLDNEQLYLKTQMVNSRFLLYDEFQLDLHLAISSYLAKDSFKFIYSKRKYLNKEKSKYITVYYLIF
jgi:hypothetical protein